MKKILLFKFKIEYLNKNSILKKKYFFFFAEKFQKIRKKKDLNNFNKKKLKIKKFKGKNKKVIPKILILLHLILNPNHVNFIKKELVKKVKIVLIRMILN
jgi:hypothetical protein